jgi:hypothetical protein
MVQATVASPTSGLSHAAETSAIAVAGSDQITIENVKIDYVELNDYVLVKFRSKKQQLYYTGQVDQKNQESEECIIKFLKNKSNSDKFNYPQFEDKWFMPASDIISELSKPLSSGGTERTKRFLSFAVDFDT